MSDYFTMLVDRDVSLVEADVTLRKIVSKLQRLKIIDVELSEDCVFSGSGYRPGLAIDDYYKPALAESPFWVLQTCGVEPNVKRHFNYWAYGPSFDGIACPHCKTFFSEVPETFADAIGEWLDQSGPAIIVCAECKTGNAIDRWDARNPLGFGNLSLTFWNWPPFDRSGWTIDIPALMQNESGNATISSYGRV